MRDEGRETTDEGRGTTDAKALSPIVLVSVANGHSSSITNFPSIVPANKVSGRLSSIVTCIEVFYVGA